MEQCFIAYAAGSANALTNAGVFPIPLVLSSGQSLANGTVTPYFPAACLAQTVCIGYHEQH